MTTSWANPEFDENIIVTINSVEYATNLYQGVQRFVLEKLVFELIQLCSSNYGSYALGTPNRNFYHEIPEELKKLRHPNAVVNYVVAQNEKGYFGINEIVVALHEHKFSLDEYIEFETLHGWSVSGFYDFITSQLSNLDLGEPYTDEEDGEEYEDFSAVFTLSNPLWED